MARGKISSLAVSRLKPGQCLWDRAVAGFGVRRQRSSSVYVLKYRFNGRQRFFTIGRHGSPWTPETARSEALRLLGRIVSSENPRDPATERADLNRTATFAEFAQRYLENYAEARKKPRSVLEDRNNLRLHVLPVLGSLRMNDISQSDVARFHVSRRRHPISANRCVALISRMFTIAEKWGVRASRTNPCRGIDRYPEVTRERYLSANEAKRLGTVLDAALAPGWSTASPCPAKKRTSGHYEDWRAVACIKLLLFTGARLSEILSLKWEYIDWQRGVARLADSKTGRRNLAITTPAIELLNSLPRDLSSPYVLPGNRPGTHFIGIQKPWQRLRSKAALSDFRLHDLRHAFASVAVTNGTSLFMVGAMLGHRHAVTTQRYAHLAPLPVKAAADEAAKAMAAMLGTSSV